MADVRLQVAAGARHVSFGDPDFLNGPAHARRVARALSAEFPGVSAPYEAPTSPDLTLETHKLSVSECVDRIVGLLEKRKLA